MKSKFKKVISTCLAAVMLLSTMLGSSISVGAAVDNDGRYVPSDGVETNRYYFLMPDDWFNEYTSDAGIYWWDATDAPDSWEDMHKAQKGDCDNVFYVDCPKDVTVIIWTNMLVESDFDDTVDSLTLPKQTVNIPCEYYDPGESDLYPDGLPEGFDNMIYVCTNITEVVNELTGLTQMIYYGDWFYYYGDGKYGTTPEPTTPEPTTPEPTTPESTRSEFEYTILDDGTAEITYYTGRATKVTIPSELDGKKVTSIGDWVFKNCKNLESITIPDSVTEIGAGAFYDTAWYKNQPDGVVYAGKVLYNYKGDMPKNTTITVKDGTKGICDYAFYDCTNLTSITIPNTVTSIGESAFANCTRLTSVTIPDSVTNIGGEAFFGCTRLTSITIPDGVTSIGDIAFGGCTSLTSVTIPASVKYIGDYAFGYINAWFDVKKIDGFKISGYGATEADRYANDNGFDFISLDEPPTKDPEVLGDVNADGKVNINDATAIQKSAASLRTLTENQKKAADVNGDGKVNINDVTVIQKYTAGIDTGFKIGE